MECPLCERECQRDYLTKHHLKTRKGDKLDIELLCKDCHSTIHRLFTNSELRVKTSTLNTVEGLLANERFIKAVAFIKTVPVGRRLRNRESNERKRKSGRRR